MDLSFLRLWAMASLLFGSLLPGAYAQEYEVKSASFQIYGMTPTPEGILLYGNGLLWLDHEGNKLRRDRLCEFLPSSNILGATTDAEGNPWLLTSKGLSCLTDPGSAQLVISEEQSKDFPARALFPHPDGSVYLLTKTALFKTKGSTTTKLFDGPAHDIRYLQDVVILGNYAYACDFKSLFKIDLSSGQPQVISEAEKPQNYRQLTITSSGKVFALTRQGLYQVENDQLTPFVKTDELGFQLSFLKALTPAENDIWLLEQNGSIYRYNGEGWKKYNLPPQIEFNTYYKDLCRDSRGNTWISMAKDPILRYDGENWKPITFDLDEAPLTYRRIFQLSPDVRYGLTTDYEIYDFNTSRRLFGADREFREVFHIHRDAAGREYWSTDKGLYIRSESSWEKVPVDGRAYNSIYYKDAVYFGAEKTFYRYRKGELEVLKDNLHFQGWEQVYGLGFHKDHLGRMLVWSSSRRGLLSIFDGESWSKLITIDGKGFGQILDIKSLGDKTFFICKGNRTPAVLEGKNWGWLNEPAFEGEEIKWVYDCPDDSIWLHTESSQLILIREDGIRKFAAPVDNVTGRARHFTAIVKIEEGVYDLYVGKDVIQCDIH